MGGKQHCAQLAFAAQIKYDAARQTGKFHGVRPTDNAVHQLRRGCKPPLSARTAAAASRMLRSAIPRGRRQFLPHAGAPFAPSQAAAAFGPGRRCPGRLRNDSSSRPGGSANRFTSALRRTAAQNARPGRRPQRPARRGRRNSAGGERQLRAVVRRSPASATDHRCFPTIGLPICTGRPIGSRSTHRATGPYRLLRRP